MTNWSNTLRAELCARARDHAKHTGVDYYASRGKAGVVLFPPSADGLRHGNFHPTSYGAINAEVEWKRRLTKAHPQRDKALDEPYDQTACELDSCTSSDALLMNVMCYPGAVAGGLARLLGVEPGTRPRFGVRAKVPLKDGKVDETELDMQIGETNVEAKLTEATFTSKAVAHVERYADLKEYFDIVALPQTDTLPDGGREYLSYQLIRNVLAVARRPAAKFRVLLDARRPDLLREWWVLHGAIKSTDLRERCGFVLWQEISAEVPKPLREFLALKYGL
jgi:hypothetical protein